MSKTLIYVSGPTGIGKTSLSVELAKKLKTEKLLFWVMEVHHTLFTMF